MGHRRVRGVGGSLCPNWWSEFVNALISVETATNGLVLFQEGVGAEGEVAAEAMAVEGDFEAVVVAFAADEGEDVVGGCIAVNMD